MPSFEEALKMITGNVSPVGIEYVGLLDAVGRVLAEDVIATCDLPLTTNSAMDGYAVQADSCSLGARLEVTGFIQAGSDIKLEGAPGCAIKIMTGALLPPCCDAVVPVEDVELENNFITILRAVSKGDHIRFRGEDVLKGEPVIASSTILRPAEIGIMASFGMATVPVYQRPLVAILSSGDELVELGEPVTDGKIINSNSFGLAAAVKAAGAIPLQIGIARDTRESLEVKIRQGLKADVLVTSAGVSAGDLDLVRDVLAELGVKQLFWKVAIKPGGPVAFGMKCNTPVFSLPGNPVSALITFEELVRPALLKMMGHSKVIRRRVAATLVGNAVKAPGKAHFFRVKVDVSDDGYLATSSGNQQTSYVKTMISADGIALLPKDRTCFAEGEKIMVNLIRDEIAMDPA